MWAPCVVDTCPLCYVPNANVDHLLLTCPCTVKYRQKLSVAVSLPWLFEDRPKPETVDGLTECDERVTYVAMAIRLAHQGIIQLREAGKLPQTTIDAMDSRAYFTC